MTATEAFENFAVTTVTSGATDAPSGGTSEDWTVTSSAGFPAASAGSVQFHVCDPAASSEIILVTNVSGAAWTVTRGAESTTPVVHAAGFTVIQDVTAGFLNSVTTTVSPAFTGTPTAPTAAALTDNTQIATTRYADSAVAVETSRAETAEALLAPKANPALTGTPTAPTATALTDTTQVATTAYADSAVAVEKTRALAAEALLAPLASPALSGTPTAPTKTALTNSTDLATTAYTDAAVAVETSRAETAEALALPLAGGTMSGAIAMGSHKVTGLTNGSGAQDAAAFGQIPVADTTASDIQPAKQSAAAGSNGKWADSGHVHPPGSAFLCPPAVYAPASIVLIETLSNTMASLNAAATTVASGSNGGEISAIGSWSSPSSGVLDVASTAGWPSAGTISVAASGSTTAVVTYTGTTASSLTGCAYVSGSATGTVATGGAVTLTAAGAGAVAVPAVTTGSFTATSTEVLVTVSLVCGINNTGDQIGFGLCAHGQITPMVGNSICLKQGLSGAAEVIVLQFLVTGLSAGSSYNYDLLFCVAGGGIATVYAIAQTTTTPLGSGPGAPVVMTVQAV